MDYFTIMFLRGSTCKGPFLALLIGGLVLGSVTSACAPYYQDSNKRRLSPKVLSLQEQLAEKGVQFIQLGDEKKWVLLSQDFFFSGGMVLKQSVYPSLIKLITLINQEENLRIAVSGYADNQPSERANFILSRQQALTVGDYLVRNGLEARVLHIVGYGSRKPVVLPKRFQSSKDYRTSFANKDLNQRVEISVRLFHSVERY